MINTISLEQQWGEKKDCDLARDCKLRFCCLTPQNKLEPILLLAPPECVMRDTEWEKRKKDEQENTNDGSLAGVKHTPAHLMYPGGGEENGNQARNLITLQEVKFEKKKSPSFRGREQSCILPVNCEARHFSVTPLHISAGILTHMFQHIGVHAHKKAD